MALEFQQTQGLKQEMQLSHRQLQALRFLQAPVADLREMVQDELMRNPVLEEAEAEPPARAEGDGADAEEAFGEEADGYAGGEAEAQAARERHEWLMGQQAVPVSLEEYLRRQCDAADLSGEEARAAEAVLGRLDAEGRFSGDDGEIAAEAGVSPEAVRSVLALLKECAPPPELHVGEDPALYVWPDAAIRRNDEGRLVAVLRGDDVPRLRISAQCREMLRDPRMGTADREYVAERIREGKFVMDAIEQRQKTLQRIVQTVADTQADFFARGVAGLHPLRQADVAERLGMDASTVSRAIKDKLVDTPQGLFPLKFFFAQGVADDVSAEAAKAALERLIEREPPGKPLSDQALADALAAEGIPLARRTVAKYREAMGVPPAHLRK